MSGHISRGSLPAGSTCSGEPERIFLNLTILSRSVSIVSWPPAPALVAVAALGAAGQPVEGGVRGVLVDGAADVDGKDKSYRQKAPPSTVTGSCSPEQALDSLVSALTPAADAADFNTLVSCVNKVDYPDIPHPHPIDVIV